MPANGLFPSGEMSGEKGEDEERASSASVFFIFNKRLRGSLLYSMIRTCGDDEGFIWASSGIGRFFFLAHGLMMHARTHTHTHTPARDRLSPPPAACATQRDDGAGAMTRIFLNINTCTGKVRFLAWLALSRTKSKNKQLHPSRRQLFPTIGCNITRLSQTFLKFREPCRPRLICLSVPVHEGSAIFLDLTP